MSIVFDNSLTALQMSGLLFLSGITKHQLTPVRGMLFVGSLSSSSSTLMATNLGVPVVNQVGETPGQANLPPQEEDSVLPPPSPSTQQI